MNIARLSVCSLISNTAHTIECRSLSTTSDFPFKMKFISFFLIFSCILICANALERWKYNIFSYNSTANLIYCSGSTYPGNEHGRFIVWQRREQIDPVLKTFNRTQWRISGCKKNFLKDTLAAHKQVIDLDISYSHLRDIDSIFEKASNLVKFNVSHNKISDIPPMFFDEIPETTEVDFSHNRLSVIYSYDFEDAKKLKKIHLSHNRIAQIFKEPFAHLNQLEFVDLRNNVIMEIEFTFPTNQRPKQLHLENNPIDEIQCNLFSLVNTSTSVYFSWKAVTDFNTSCTMDPIHVVANSESEGVLVGPTKKPELHCNQNAFADIYDLYDVGYNFENAGELLECLGPSLDSIDITGNFVGKINKNTLRKFINLDELTLSGTKLSEFDFEMVPHGLETLDISNNHPITLLNIPHLSQLGLLIFNISGNQLRNTMEILQNLNNETMHLDISGNYLDFTTVKNPFEKVKNARFVAVQNANLTSSNLNVFEPLHDLVWLDVSNNKLDKFTLVPMPELIYLEIHDNDLTELHNLTRSRFPKLVFLSIGNNNFSCEYLTTFMTTMKHEFEVVDFNGDPMQQKHGVKCEIKTSASKAVLYFVVIGVLLALGGLISAAVFIFRIHSPRVLLDSLTLRGHDTANLLT